MKKKVCKQIGWLSMLMFYFNLAFASQPQLQNELVLPYLLHDSIVSTAIVSNHVPATTIPLQSNIRNYVEKYLDQNASILERIKEQKSGTFKTI